MYQLEQPPEFHTVGGSFRCRASFQNLNASGRTANECTPSLRIVRSASVTYAICDSIMCTMRAPARTRPSNRSMSSAPMICAITLPSPPVEKGVVIGHRSPRREAVKPSSLVDPHAADAFQVEQTLDQPVALAGRERQPQLDPERPPARLQAAADFHLEGLAAGRSVFHALQTEVPERAGPPGPVARASPETERARGALAARLGDMPHVTTVLDPRAAGLIAGDGQTALARVQYDGDTTELGGEAFERLEAANDNDPPEQCKD